MKQIAKDVISEIEKTKAIGITYKDILSLNKKYIIQASVFVSLPTPGVDIVMVRRNIKEMFDEINSLLKIDYIESEIDDIASTIVSSLKFEYNVSIALATVKWGNPKNYVAQGALDVMVAQITDSACIIYLKSLLRAIKENIGIHEAVKKVLS